MLMVKTALIGGLLWGGVKRIPGLLNVGVNLAGKGVQATTYLGKNYLFNSKIPILGKIDPLTKGIMGATFPSSVSAVHSSATNAFANPSYARRIFMN